MARLNSKGQFFSQDLIIAIIIFTFSALMFLVASQAVFSQVTLVTARNAFDESAHITLTTLVEHPGEPVGWEKLSFDDINSFGLAKTNNVLEQEKVERLFYYLDNDYDATRIQLGVSNFDLNLILVDEQGDIIYASGKEATNTRTKLIYERAVFYDGYNAVLKGVFSSD